MRVQKSTQEIKKLLGNANIDFDLAVNNALNDYLPKVFLSCPFTEELCHKQQCVDCESSTVALTSQASKATKNASY